VKTVFRLLSIVVGAIFDVADDKPVKSNLGRYRARELFDDGLISGNQYNQARIDEAE